MTVRRSATARLLPELLSGQSCKATDERQGAADITTAGANDLQFGLKKQKIGVIKQQAPSHPLLGPRLRPIHGCDAFVGGIVISRDAGETIMMRVCYYWPRPWRAWSAPLRRTPPTSL